MTKAAFKIWLILLATTSLTLVWLLTDKPAQYPSIGGGGYNLDKFVYGWLIHLLTGAWAIGGFSVWIMSEGRAAANRAIIFAALGLAGLFGSIWFYGDYLS